MNVFGGILNLKKATLSLHLILYLEISLPTLAAGEYPKKV